MTIVPQVEIHTDGACSGNPGPGGWSAILVMGVHEKEIAGGEPDTTNNRMELTAAIMGLKALKRHCVVTLYSDSQYLVDAFNKKWIRNWLRNGWVNAQKKPVPNRDLWEQLLELTRTHQVAFVKVEGHSGDKYNERCDYLAKEEIRKKRVEG